MKRLVSLFSANFGDGFFISFAPFGGDGGLGERKEPLSWLKVDFGDALRSFGGEGGLGERTRRLVDGSSCVHEES